MGKGGKTAYERWKGKRFKVPMAEFGERVLYLKPKSKGKDKYESRWEEGIWLGVDDESRQYRIADVKGIVKTGRVQRLAKGEDRWQSGLQEKTEVRPWDKTSVSREPEVKGVKLDIQVP